MFSTFDGKFIGFRAEGHTGYAPKGEDIVCAAVSSLIQSTILGLEKLVGIGITLQTNQESGLIQCLLTEERSANKSQKADLLLGTMFLGLEQIAENYDKHVKISIKEVD